VVVDKLYRLRS